MRRYALMPGGDDRHLAKDAIRRASGGAVPAGRLLVLRNFNLCREATAFNYFFDFRKFNAVSVDSC